MFAVVRNWVLCSGLTLVIIGCSPPQSTTAIVQQSSSNVLNIVEPPSFTPGAMPSTTTIEPLALNAVPVNSPEESTDNTSTPVQQVLLDADQAQSLANTASTLVAIRRQELLALRQADATPATTATTNTVAVSQTVHASASTSSTTTSSPRCPTGMDRQSAMIQGSGNVGPNVLICGRVIISGSADIGGNSQLFGPITISGSSDLNNVVITRSTISGSGTIVGSSIANSVISGSGKIRNSSLKNVTKTGSGNVTNSQLVNRVLSGSADIVNVR